MAAERPLHFCFRSGLKLGKFLNISSKFSRSKLYSVDRGNPGESIASPVRAVRDAIILQQHFKVAPSNHLRVNPRNGPMIIKWISCNLQPLNILSSKYRRFGQRDNSKSYGKRILQYGSILTFLGLKKEEPEESILINTIKRGILCLQKDDYDAAESILHLALKIAQEQANQEAQTYIYDVMANTAFQKGDYPKAETLLIEVMKRALASGKAKDDNAIVDISLKLAAIYGFKHDDKKAEEGFRFCIESQQNKIDKLKIVPSDTMSDMDQDTVALWAMSCDWYAKYLMGKGQYEKAQDCFSKALTVSEKVNGPHHPQTLVLMNDIGTVATLREDYTTAISYLENAIQIGQKYQLPDLPSFYCNLGQVYLQKGDYEQAEVTCEKAVSLAKRMDQKEAEKEALLCLQELKKLRELVQDIR